MQKLFELTSKDWMTGVAVSSHYPASGIFSDAVGVSPFITPFTLSNDLGLLQASAAPVETQSSVVVGPVWGGTLDGAAYKGYFIDDEGHFYEQATNSDGSPTDLRSGTPITSPAEGVAIYQINGGTRYIYYAREDAIGRWDLSGSYPTGWNDTYIQSAGTLAIAGIQTTKIRNFHQFVGNLYWTNKDRIGAIIDTGAGGSLTTANVDSNVLDLPSTLTAVDIDDDGFYLVIAATENTISGNTITDTINKIYFWDTAGNSWQREWSIETGYIAGIKRVGSIMYALCADGLYAFSFNTPPTLIVPLGTNDAPSVTGGEVPTSHILDERNGVLYWCAAGGHICAYGSPLPGLSPRFYKPYDTLTGIPRFFMWSGRTKIYTASDGATETFGFILPLSSGNTGVSAETIYLPLGQKFNILKMEVILGEPLASGDSLNIDVKSDEDTSASDWGTVSFASLGAKRTAMLPNRFTAENLQLIFNFNGGNVKIKKIVGYGEPVTI